MNNRGEIRLNEEMLINLGFQKENTFITVGRDKTKTYRYVLNLCHDSSEDFKLSTNFYHEHNFPEVTINNVETYEFLYAEPLIILLNILQSNCVIENFKIN